MKYSFTGVVATEMKLLVKKRFTHKNQYQSGCDKDHLSINYFGSGLLAYIVAWYVKNPFIENRNDESYVSCLLSYSTKQGIPITAMIESFCLSFGYSYMHDSPVSKK